MIHITPRGSFPIVRQLEDVTDSTTYYVRGVVRDSRTGTILATVNLTDNGNQRFTYNYAVPADPSGEGRYIDITTIVYNDSGYTTRAGFADENETYLIKDDKVLGGGIGMGETVSYSEIRKIIKEELGKLEIPEVEIQEVEEKDITPVITAMEGRIVDAIKGIRIPEPEKVNLDPVLMGLDEVVNTLLIAIDNKEVTPETDLMPVLEAIQQLPVQELIEVYNQAKDMTDTLNAVVENQAELDQLRTAAEQFVQATSTKKLPQPKEQVNPMQERVRRLLGNTQMA